MPKSTQVQYRVIMEIPSEGIERSLPYTPLEEEEAKSLAKALNDLLYPKYHHRVEPVISHHMSSRERTYAYHGEAG